MRKLLRVLAYGTWIVVLAAATRLFLKSYVVTEDSMAGTLLHGDVVLVWKGGTRLAGRMDRVELERFDVVASKSPLGESVVIKRVVGLPGDTIAMEAGRLLLNGREVDEPWAIAGNGRNRAIDWRLNWQREYLVDDGSQGPYLPSLDAWGPLEVPPRRYFLLGDNRPRSVDSRQVGLVAHANVVGKVAAVLWSHGKHDARVPDAESRARWDRILRRVE